MVMNNKLVSSPHLIAENLVGLSLEAMGFLLLIAAGGEPEHVHSSPVTMQCAKEELIEKGRIHYKPKEL